MRVAELELTPFVLGLPRFVGGWAERSPVAGTRMLDVLDPAQASFFALLNRANALAYGGMAMPAWVQLDCVTLPGALVGFALPRAALPAGLAGHFGEALEGYAGLVPVCAWGGVCTPESDTLVGFTLFSLLPGLRLGLRAKALALLLAGARTQVGVTRRSGPVRRTHEQFGPLQVLCDRPAVHPDAEETIVYELTVPSPETLMAMVQTGAPPLSDP